MSHPITAIRRTLLIYFILWICIATIQGLIFHMLLELPVGIVIADTLLSVFSLAMLGLLAWYPTRYIPFQRSKPLTSLSAHILAGLMILAIWLGFVWLVLGELIQDPAYQLTLNATIVQRAAFGGIAYLILVLIYYLLSNSQKLEEKVKHEEQLKALVREAELNMLKAQINPHFLFNSLNSISSLTMSNPEEARDMIIRLSDFLRYSLQNRESEFVPLGEELRHMKDYLSIEKVRFGDKLLYEFDMPGSCKDFPVPTMLFQPLFENAIRHSVYESTEPVSLNFSCRSEGNSIHVSLSNNYDPSIPPRRGTGLGLQHVRQRVRLAYEDRGNVHWSGDNGIFEVNLIIPGKEKLKN